jgi:hypothetical protein
MMACWLGAALSLAVGPKTAVTDFVRNKGGCESNTVGVAVSTDDAWMARVQEEVCSDGAFVTTVVAYVQVAQRGSDPMHEHDVFAVEEVGGAETVPNLQWLEPQ